MTQTRTLQCIHTSLPLCFQDEAAKAYDLAVIKGGRKGERTNFPPSYYKDGCVWVCVCVCVCVCDALVCLLRAIALLACEQVLACACVCACERAHECVCVHLSSCVGTIADKCKTSSG